MSPPPSKLWQYLRKALLFSSAFCVVFVICTAFWAGASAASHSLLYRATTDSGPPTAGQLEQTARMVQARLAALKSDFGLRRPSVQVEGRDGLRVEFRSRSDINGLLRWLTMPARVELRLLPADQSALERIEPGAAPSGADMPEGCELKTYIERKYKLARPNEMATYEHNYLVYAEPAMRVPSLDGVYFSTKGLKKMTVITFEFNEKGAEELKRLTALNIGRELAILIDGELFFPAKKIPSAIKDGRIQMMGYFYNPPLRKLVNVLAAGSLPCSLEEISHEVQ